MIFMKYWQYYLILIMWDRFESLCSTQIGLSAYCRTYRAKFSLEFFY